MIEADKRLKQHLSQKHLITALSKSGYPFAVWRLPQSNDKQIIICLTEVANQSISLEDCGTGFLVNSFSDQHPAHPFFISGDIIITRERGTTIDPKINAHQIDEFTDNLRNTSEHRGNETKAKERFLVAGQEENKNAYINAVNLAIKEIKKGTFEKVVLSRCKEIDLPDGFDLEVFFDKVCHSYVNAFCSVVGIPGKGIWIGATPETLLSNDKDKFKTVALAGTKTFLENQVLSEIAWTQKEIEEQAFVSRYVINCFKKIRLREFHEHGPKAMKAGNLAHLKTTFEVDFNEITFSGLADQMLELLHPTSAVCGMPLKGAKSFIDQVEGYDREFYSGFLGPVNYEGITHLFVNLRCLKIDGHRVKLFAGAGITEDSVPIKEYEETLSKMNIMYSILDD